MKDQIDFHGWSLYTGSTVSMCTNNLICETRLQSYNKKSILSVLISVAEESSGWSEAIDQSEVFGFYSPMLRPRNLRKL